MGNAYSLVVASGDTYEATGLGAGRYEVYARDWSSGERVFYSDSVDVGYSQTVPDINLDFDPPGVEEGQQPAACGPRPAARVIRRLPVDAVAFDAMGRRAVNPKPGVYFVVSEPSAVSRQPSAVTIRKVILQR